MSKLDKELEKICRSLELDADSYTEQAIAQIKTVILEALKAEMPNEETYQSPDWKVPHTAEMLIAYAEGWDKAIDDCLEVCNKLLGDSNE